MGDALKKQMNPVGKKRGKQRKKINRDLAEVNRTRCEIFTFDKLKKASK